jgi:hypothetical protein
MAMLQAAGRACRVMVAPVVGFVAGRLLTPARRAYGPLPDEQAPSDEAEAAADPMESGRALCREYGWLSDDQVDAAKAYVAANGGSVPPMSGGDTYHAPEAVSGSRASAMAWAEAISAAGAALSDEGFEDEALGCFRVAGELLEKVEAWGRPA